MPIYYELVSSSELAPDEKFMLGFKYDVQNGIIEGRIHSWCVLANTPHGTIPAKAIGDKAWYTYHGKVYMTADFSYLKADPSAKVTLQEADSPPLGAIHGDLLDGKPSYMVICDTSSAEEPGKSDGVISQFGWNGLEYDEEDFRYVCISGPYSFVAQHSENQNPESTDLMLGNDKWGYTEGPLWCVMTHSTHGWLPGLASKKWENAWYTYGPKVCKTTDFHYIRPDHGYEAMLKAADSSPPKHGVVVGQGKYDNQPIYSVVCHVEGDDIPGLYSGGSTAFYQVVYKYKPGVCWVYPGGTSTMEAENFSYVVVVERGPEAKEDANKNNHCSEDELD